MQSIATRRDDHQPLRLDLQGSSGNMDVVHSNNAIDRPFACVPSARKRTRRVVSQPLSGVEPSQHKSLAAILIAKVSLHITRRRNCRRHQSYDTQRNEHAKITESLVFHGRAL
jgi:hypothetical protein